jgi:membrane protein involved in colicin uptake
MKNKTLVIALASVVTFSGLTAWGARTVHEREVAEQAKVELAAKKAKVELAAKQAAAAKEEAAAEARKLARCAKDDVGAVLCDRYLEALGQIEDSQRHGSYGAHLDRQAQRNNDLAYCRENPSDWSCTEGQYRGQY